MNKAETAEYLVNLHTLMDAQEATGGGSKSKVLLQEYHREWESLKNLINEEQDETRNSQLKLGLAETGTDSKSDLAGSGIADRNPRGNGEGSGAVVQRPRV